MSVLAVAAGAVASFMPATGASAPEPAVPAPDLVVNGAFEQGAQGWRTDERTSRFAVSAGAGHEGSNGARLRSIRGGTVVLNDRINTVRSTPQGGTYDVQARVKISKPRVSGQLRIREVSSGGLHRSAASTFWLQDTQWHTVTLRYTAEAAGRVLDLNVLAWNVPVGVELAVDDVSMRRVDGGAPAPTEPAAPTATPSPTSPEPTMEPPVSTTVPAPTPTTSSSPATTPPATSPAPAPEPAPGGGVTRSPTGCRALVDLKGLPSCGAYLGAAIGGNQDPTARESQVGGRLPLRRTYFRGDQVDSAVATARRDIADGRLPWISFKLPHSWSDMAAGKGDAWARDLTARLDALPGPVWLAFHHEPEGDGDMREWTRMQARLSPIVRSGSDNVAFTVIVMGWHQFFGSTPEYRLEALWPGDEHVDILAFDIYNPYGEIKDGKARTKSMELKEYYDRLAPWAKAHGVAWAVAETGYTHAAADRDPKWLDRAYKDMIKANGIALAYFDSELNSIGSWPLETAAKRQAFGALLKDSIRMR